MSQKIIIIIVAFSSPHPLSTSIKALLHLAHKLESKVSIQHSLLLLRLIIVLPIQCTYDIRSYIDTHRKQVLCFKITCPWTLFQPNIRNPVNPQVPSKLHAQG